MRMTTRRGLLAALVCGGLAPGLPKAAGLPPSLRSGPVRLVVPYPPGGTFDLVGRRFGQVLSARIGVPVVVENIAGAGAAQAVNNVANARPDGTSLLILPNSTLTIVPTLYAKPPFAVTSIEAIGLIATAQYVLVARSDFGAGNLQELLALARQQPDRISFGSFGTGTASHLSGEWINQLAGVRMLHVPYRGSAAALADLMGGNIAVTVDAIPATRPHIAAGKLKALAVTGVVRSELLPDVPTVAESGLPGFRTEGWIGLAGPAGMPADVRMALAGLLASITDDPAFRGQLRELGVEPVAGGQPDMPALLADERNRYRQIIERAGIRLD